MSMSEPLEPSPGAQHGAADEKTMPAADAGGGAPPPSPGFGVAGEEPDSARDDEPDGPDRVPQDTPFRTPDPGDVGGDE